MATNVETIEQAEQERITEESPARPASTSANEREERTGSEHGVFPGAALPASPTWFNPPTQQLVPVSRELVQEIATLVGEGEVARFIDDVLGRELQSRRILEYLAETAEESGGPITAEERAWAASLLWPT